MFGIALLVTVVTAARNPLLLAAALSICLYAFFARQFSQSQNRASSSPSPSPSPSSSPSSSRVSSPGRVAKQSPSVDELDAAASSINQQASTPNPDSYDPTPEVQFDYSDTEPIREMFKRSDQRVVQPRFLRANPDYLVAPSVMPSAKRTFRVLSIGCNAGVSDLELLPKLMERVGSDCVIEYHAVEPFSEPLCKFQNDLKAAGFDERVTLHSHAMTFEKYIESVEAASIRPTFDLVLFIHSLYYFGKIHQVGLQLEKAMTLLHDSDSLLTIIHAWAPETTYLHETLAKPALPMVTGREIVKHLVCIPGFQTVYMPVTSAVEVTDCFEPGHRGGRATASFLVALQMDKLPVYMQTRALQLIKSASTCQSDPNHPQGGRRYVDRSFVVARLSKGASAAISV